MNRNSSKPKQVIKYYISLLVVTILLTSCSKKDLFYLGGIQVAEDDSKTWVQGLKKAKMNTVSVTVYAKQGDWDSDNLWHSGFDENVIEEIRAAKKAGLHVVLILRVALDHAYERNRFLWHGMIMPKDRKALDSWFKKYTEYVLLWAKIAQKERVDVLGIGSELKALSATRQGTDSTLTNEYDNFIDWQQKYKRLVINHKDELSKRHLWVRGQDNFADLENFLTAKAVANTDWAKKVYFKDEKWSSDKVRAYRKLLQGHWETLIQKVRENYRRQITYASNFDNYERVAFWNQLDLVGINAYFKLRDLEDEGLDLALSKKLDKSWQQIFNDLDSFRVKEGIVSKVLFTELGYTFRESCTIAPWAHDEFSVVEKQDTSQLFIWYEQPIDKTERFEAIQSLYRVNQSYNLLKGILYWKLSTKKEHSKYEDFLLYIGEDSEDPLLEFFPTFINQ